MNRKAFFITASILLISVGGVVASRLNLPGKLGAQVRISFKLRPGDATAENNPLTTTKQLSLSLYTAADSSSEFISKYTVPRKIRR